MRRTVFMAVLLVLLLAGSAAAAENVYNQVNEAVKAQSAGDLQGAFQLYTKIIESGKLQSDPKILAYLYNNRAVIWLQRGNEGMALEDFEQALELYPDHTTYYNRALILSERGRTKEALADLNKAIEMFPDYGSAYELRGHLLVQSGKPGQGREDLRTARRLKLKLRFLGPGEYKAGPRQMQRLQQNPAGDQPARERRRVE